MKRKIQDIFKKPYIIGLLVIFAVIILIPEIWHLGKGQLVEGSIDKLEEKIQDKARKKILKEDLYQVEASKIVEKTKDNLENKPEESKEDKKKAEPQDEVNEDRPETIKIEIASTVSRSKPISNNSSKGASNKTEERSITDQKPVQESPIREEAVEKKPVIKTEEKTVTEELGFNTIKKNDPNLEKGKETVSQEGQKGIRTIVYRVTYTDGKETSKAIVKDTITKNPVDRIVVIGSKENKPAPAPAPTTNPMDLPNNYAYNYNASLEDHMIKLINDYRASKGLNRLEKRGDLSKSARYKANSMLQLNYFAHSNPNLGNNNSSYLIRTAFGYSHYSGTGENLTAEATGERSIAKVERAFQRFQLSSAHDKNMLNPQWRYVGVGVLGADKSGSKFGGIPTFIITQHFGK